MSIDLKSNVHQNNLKELKLCEKTVYEFEDFRLEAAHLMLYRREEEIHLPPKQVETLLALVEHGGEIISKDELIERLWANAFVEESNLIQNIYVLRKILGDTSDGKPMIETLRRRGYRFNGKLKQNGNKEAVSIKQAAKEKANEILNFHPERVRQEIGGKAHTTAFPIKKNSPIALAAVLTLIALAGLGFYFFPPIKTGAPNTKSIAVLPVNPVIAANRDDIYEVGITDSLITRLGALKGLVVRPLGATRKFSDINQDPIAAGKELKTDYVLASNYQITNGKIRITAQLYNVESGQIEETYKSEKDTGNIFALQDAIAGEVGNLLQTRFATTTGDSIAKRGTNNEEAYRLYLQGKNLMMKRNLDDFKKSIKYFEQAIRLDPNYASAYAGLAGVSIGAEISNVNGTRGPAEKQQSAEQIRENLVKALQIDPNLAEAYAVRGQLDFIHDWNLDSAEKNLLRAIELEPNNDHSHWLYSLVLAYRGRFDEAIKEVETAQVIYPGALMYMRDRGRYLYYARRYDEAIDQLNRVIDLDEDFGTAYGWLLWSFELKGDYDAAYRTFIKRQQKVNPDRVEVLQKSYEGGGWLAVRRKQLEISNSEAKFGDAYFEMARSSAVLGEKEQAFEFLNKAIERRDWQIIMLNVEPTLDLLRGDPRFDELLKRVGLK